jgi:hypothetical protein
MKYKILFLPAYILIILFSYNCANNSSNNPMNPGGGSTDTAFQSFIILFTGSTPFDTLNFTDRNLCIGQYNSGSNSTYCLLNDTASQQNISVSFTGNNTGSPTFTFGFMTYQGGSYNGSAITGTVTIYEGVGGKIKGTYVGNFSNGTTTYGVRATFTVRRTQ